MNKRLLPILSIALLCGCYSTANFKSANLIKPHLFPSKTSSKKTPKADAKQLAHVDRFVYFEFNSAILSAQAKLTLDANLPFLREITKGQIVLQGHTDDVGSETDNHLLAKRRALAVWVYLIENGIDETRLNPVSLGEEVMTHDAISSANQRHVELIY